MDKPILWQVRRVPRMEEMRDQDSVPVFMDNKALMSGDGARRGRLRRAATRRRQHGRLESTKDLSGALHVRLRRPKRRRHGGPT